MKNKQDYSYWNSKESVNNYSQYEGLFDREKLLLMDAIGKIGKQVKDLKILDLGCGAGRTTKPLLEMGFRVWAIDIAENLIKILSKKLPDVSVSVGSASALPYDSGFFDIVLFSHNSIDYLYPYEERRKSYEEVFRVLKKDGFYIFSSHQFNFLPYNKSVALNLTLNIKNWVGLRKNGYFIEKMSNGQKVTTYSAGEKAIKDEVERAGFKFIRSLIVQGEDKSLTKSFLKAKTSWERYYLVQKI